MTIKVAINGYGRIGRNILRALYEGMHRKNIQIVAINNLGDPAALAHLTKYDSTHGTFSVNVTQGDEYITVDGDTIQLVSERDPARLPWGKLGVDVVYECTGAFASKTLSQAHISAGAKKVIISAPAGKDVDATIVYGVNHQILSKNDTIISNASCTTNCLAPIVQPLHAALGIEQGFMTTVHAYTNDQVLTDGYHKDLRRARSATASMIPTKTGAASAVGLVLPELAGRLDGMAVRVPTPNVSMVDLTATVQQSTTVEEVNRIIKTASEGALSRVLSYNDQPLVSCDFNHNAASAIFDATQTKVMGQLIKVFAWYDNEWGFSNRMLDTTVALMAVA